VNEQNSAAQLLAIFRSWESGLRQGHGAAYARNWESNPDGAVADHISAWRHLGALSRVIDGLSNDGFNMTMSKEYLPQWGRMAASVGASWTSNNHSVEPFPADAMFQLQALSTILELAQTRTGPANLDLLSDVVTQASELLKGDESLSDELRSYLVKLVREIRNALEDDTLGGGFNFAEAAERLWVAMQAAAGESRENSEGWKHAAASLLPSAAAGVLTHMGVVGFDTVMKALGS
jgi:hypothetical protein